MQGFKKFLAWTFINIFIRQVLGSNRDKCHFRNFETDKNIPTLQRSRAEHSESKISHGGQGRACRRYQLKSSKKLFFSFIVCHLKLGLISAGLKTVELYEMLC